MRSFALLAAVFALVGCAHIDREQAMSVNRYDVMTDAEVARVALSEALGGLHEVHSVDVESGRALGRPAFDSRDERLSFDRRVDALLRAAIYGQGPAVELVSLHCERQARTGWAQWPGAIARRPEACRWTDQAVSIHSLFKKPALHRAYVDTLLRILGDAQVTADARPRLAHIQAGHIEPYVIVVEAWEQLEGFRPRG